MSGVSKALLDKVGGFRCEHNTISIRYINTISGFRCEHRGLLDLGVMVMWLYCQRIVVFCSA